MHEPQPMHRSISTSVIFAMEAYFLSLPLSVLFDYLKILYELEGGRKKRGLMFRWRAEAILAV